MVSGDLLASYYVRLGVAALLGSHLSNDCCSALAGYIHNMLCGLGSRFLLLCDFVGSLLRPRLVFSKIIFINMCREQNQAACREKPPVTVTVE